MADSYRPGGRGPRGHPPPLADRISFTGGGGDSYRPGEQHRGRQNGGRTAHHAEFTFSSTYQAPQFPPTGPADANERGARRKRNRGGASAYSGERNGAPIYTTIGGRNNANNFRRGGFRRPPTHERALLQTRDDSTEHVLGVANGLNKFRNLEDLSDDEEASMDFDSDKSDTNDGQDGKTKAARVQSDTRADGNSVPKWSNPDPYTVLPPPEETTGKRIDVVKLIRKAKNEMTGKADPTNAVTANDDFISFADPDVDNDDEKQSVIEDDMPPLAPWARPFSQGEPLLGSLNDLVASGALPAPIRRATNSAGLPERPQYPRSAHKRKRAELHVGIIEEWLPHPRQQSAPWATDGRNEHLSQDPQHWLHNEILDFYDFVMPLQHEDDIRHRLVERIERAIGRNHFAPIAGRIRCFGSFPAGLYLPMADMDLVYTSDHHDRGGPKSISCTKNALWKVARKLERKDIATDITVIASAKVPIIKFKDRLTGIPVDISFENLSGVQAQQTFKAWKMKYPDLVYIVALIKQFLLMRGVSEVATGGLGGFSIICLVVHWIQVSDKPDNLGHFLLEFLDYYGNLFDLSRHRIEMSPPYRLEKTEYGIDDRKEKLDGLSIQDPNRPDNNISGGSYKAKDIFKAFSEAHRDLTDQMAAIRHGAVSSKSILDSIIGGNYSPYMMHRRHMRNLNMRNGQSESASVDVPPKPPKAGKATKGSNASKKQKRSQERLPRNGTFDSGTSSVTI